MTELSPAGRRLQAARAELKEATAAAKAQAVADVKAGISEVKAARRNSLARETVRGALGK